MGMILLGLKALPDMLRIKSGLIFAGYEFSDQTNLFEAGISFTVPLKTKDDDFIGKAQIGEITSAVKSPILGKVIAVCVTYFVDEITLE